MNTPATTLIQTIRPYPSELQEHVQYAGRDLLLRPIRAEDLPLYRTFLAQITSQDLYTRFFVGVHELPEPQVAHFTHIDYDREMAFVAVGRNDAGQEELLGVVRACADPGKITAEFAVLVRSDLKGKGLGSLLMHKLIRYCRAEGIQRLRASVLSENAAMLHLSKVLGFRVRSVDRNVEEIELDLPGVSTLAAEPCPAAPLIGAR
jgi:acetyltransferase